MKTDISKEKILSLSSDEINNLFLEEIKLRENINSDACYESKYLLNCYFCESCNDCKDCRDCKSCKDCESCNDCKDCRDCRDCLFCLYCLDLSDKAYCIFNVQFNKYEYESILAKLNIS